jgi:hypothetical protein
MTHKALVRRLQISCLGLDRIDPLCLLVDDVVAALAQPQRTWVGLTDEDKHEIELRAGITEDDDGYIVSQVFKLTEAKLKEKNCL